MDLSWSF